MGNNKFTEDQIKEAAKNSKSFAEMCRQLGLIPAGGNYASMKRRVVRYNIDISHFTGQGWNVGNFSDQPNKKISIKRKLIRERGHQCEKCKNTVWLEVPITLELEHIDGDNSNNVEDNLLLLCPNCHAQTKTWRRAKSSFVRNPKLICSVCDGPKLYKSETCLDCFQSGKSGKKQEIAEKLRKPIPEKFCSCGKVIDPRSTQCAECLYLGRQKIVWPPANELVIRLRDNKESWVSVGKSLGVATSSIRRHLRRNNIDPKTFLPLDTETKDTPE